MKARKFVQVDVFTNRACLGNPVAVVTDAQDLSDDDMQTIARWTNLSETTFLLPSTDPNADYRLRIFTPRAELPFAGHPTLGSLFAAIKCGLIQPKQGRWTQQCQIGLIELSGDQEQGFFLRLPEPQFKTFDRQQVQQILASIGASGTSTSASIDTIAQVSIGASWITVQLPSAQEVLTLQPDQAAVALLSERNNATGITVFGAYALDAATNQPVAGYEVRSFAPAHGVDEDPVCGSGNGSVALLLAKHGRRTDYRARQGRAIGRDGFIQVKYRDGATFIGGQCVAVVEGTIHY